MGEMVGKRPDSAFHDDSPATWKLDLTSSDADRPKQIEATNSPNFHGII